MNYGPQIGVITHGSNLNLRYWIDEAKSQGFVCVLCDGYTRLHAPAK